MIWHPVLVNFYVCIWGICYKHASKMHRGQAKGNWSSLSHAADLACFFKFPITYLTLTSLKRFMKRGPKRQGLWRWHCRELTVIWVARWDATATMYTASYIKAASVCSGCSERKLLFCVIKLHLNVSCKQLNYETKRAGFADKNAIKTLKVPLGKCAKHIKFGYNDEINITENISVSILIKLKKALNVSSCFFVCNYIMQLIEQMWLFAGAGVCHVK